MKVNSTSIQARSKQSAQKPSEKKPSQEEIKARIQAKFGVKVGEEKKAAKKEQQEQDVVVSIDTKGNKKVENGAFGDIRNNNPDSEVTQEKLRGILRAGGFDFNPKERKALDAILNG